MSINIESINKIIEDRKKAADEAAKIQAVLTELDKVCAEKGFEGYAAFLSAAKALEGGDAARRGATGGKKRGRPSGTGNAKPKAKGEGKRKRLDQRAKDALGKLVASGKSATEISKELGIGYQTAYLWKKRFSKEAGV